MKDILFKYVDDALMKTEVHEAWKGFAEEREFVKLTTKNFVCDFLLDLSLFFLQLGRSVVHERSQLDTKIGQEFCFARLTSVPSRLTWRL